MLICSLVLWFFLLPYTVSVNDEKVDYVEILREHCAPLIHDGFCNLECPEAADLEEHYPIRHNQLQSDCVLFPVKTVRVNLTQTFDSDVVWYDGREKNRTAMFAAATMASIYMQTRVTTSRELAPNRIKVFMEVEQSVSEEQLKNKMNELESEIFRLLNVNITSFAIHMDNVPPPAGSQWSTAVFIIGAVIVCALFGTMTVSVRSSNRTRDSREMEAPVWTIPKEQQLGFSKQSHMVANHYQQTMMQNFGQQIQNYEHFLNGSYLHHTHGFQQSPNLIPPAPVAQKRRYQQPTLLHTQAFCGNITTPINPSEVRQPVNGIHPIHAVVLRATKDEAQMIEDIQKILEAGGNINEKTCIEVYWNPANKAVKDEETALYIAVTRNLCEVAEFLLKNGADQWAINRSNSTCVHEAVYGSNTKMLEILLKYHKSDPKREELIDGFEKIESLNYSLLTPLMCCVYAGPYFSVQMATMLIEAGAKVDTTEDKKRRNVVHYTAMLNNGELLDYLLSLDNIKLEAQDDDEATALMLAVQNGYTEIVEKLLAAGASYTSTNVNLQNSLHVAQANNFWDIVKIIKESKLPRDQKKRKSSAASSPTEPRSTLADLTNNNTVFQTPPSSYENNLGYQPFHAYLTPPESDKSVAYDFARHSSQLFV